MLTERHFLFNCCFLAYILSEFCTTSDGCFRLYYYKSDYQYCKGLRLYQEADKTSREVGRLIKIVQLIV